MARPEVRFYLAGKIGKNDWRHQVVPGLRSINWDQEYRSWERGGWRPTKTVFAGVQCTGPFFTGCDHGCAHGGVEGEPGIGCHGVREDPICGAPCPRELVVQWCREAISSCDVFYAWLGPDGPLDDVTAYGTLVELGYAKGGAGDTLVKVITAAPSLDTDLWFAHHLADKALVADNPISGLTMAIQQARYLLPRGYFA